MRFAAEQREMTTDAEIEVGRWAQRDIAARPFEVVSGRWLCLSVSKVGVFHR